MCPFLSIQCKKLGMTQDSACLSHQLSSAQWPLLLGCAAHLLPLGYVFVEYVFCHWVLACRWESLKGLAMMLRRVVLQLNDRIARCLQSVLPENRGLSQHYPAGGENGARQFADALYQQRPHRTLRSRCALRGTMQPAWLLSGQAARGCDSYHDVSPHAGPSLKPFRGSQQLKRLRIGIRQWGCHPPGPGKRAGGRLIHQWKEEFGDSWTSSGSMSKYAN